ncbi:FAD:protein FMN transferase [Neptuniibacter halophilus]|uniref:FAD:protein FMN transferase n=1 Tax=Neptuniibacter halophilus TaxID=651666 RepID=UPI002572FE00|nr:FAD:protein FMN transferase [Neptuniibacter halophilus]
MTLVVKQDMFVAGQTSRWPAALLLAPLFLFLSLLSGCQSDPEPRILIHQGATMGTSFTVKWLAMDDNPQLRQQIDQALVDVNQSMSTYINDSELSRINQLPAGSEVAVSDELGFVLSVADRISRETRGAFDATVGPLVNLWGFGPDGRVIHAPAAEQIAEIRTRVGFQYLDLSQGFLRKQRDSYIDLSAIAKGYGVDKLAMVLEQQGIDRYLVEIGGELRAKGIKPDGQNWKIAIESPMVGPERKVQRIIAVKDVGVATSGDYRNYFEENGIRFSHTIDPVDGKPIRHKLASVTVLMPTCAEADAYATAMMVMGPERAEAFAIEQGISAFFIVKADQGFTERMTPGFKQFLVQ